MKRHLRCISSYQYAHVCFWMTRFCFCTSVHKHQKATTAPERKKCGHMIGWINFTLYNICMGTAHRHQFPFDILTLYVTYQLPVVQQFQQTPAKEFLEIIINSGVFVFFAFRRMTMHIYIKWFFCRFLSVIF